METKRKDCKKRATEKRKLIMSSRREIQVQRKEEKMSRSEEETNVVDGFGEGCSLSLF